MNGFSPPSAILWRRKIQADGRIRKWSWVEEKRAFLRVILLGDGETVHNAFFDRRYPRKERE